MEELKELIAQEIEKQRRSSNMLVMTIKEEPSDKDLIEACVNLANKFIKAPFLSSMKVIGSESVEVYTSSFNSYFNYIKVVDMNGEEEVMGEASRSLLDFIPELAERLYKTLKPLGKEAVVVIHMKPSEL